MWGKLQVGKWLPCQIGCTVAYMNWDAFDALFNSYFLVKRIFLLPTHTWYRSILTMYRWHWGSNTRSSLFSDIFDWAVAQTLRSQLSVSNGLFPPVSRPLVKNHVILWTRQWSWLVPVWEEVVDYFKSYHLIVTRHQIWQHQKQANYQGKAPKKSPKQRIPHNHTSTPTL